jgi:hypothetical protein
MNRQHCPLCSAYVKVIAPDFICENCGQSMRQNNKATTETQIDSSLNIDGGIHKSKSSDVNFKLDITPPPIPVSSNGEEDILTNIEAEKAQKKLHPHTQILDQATTKPKRNTKYTAGWLVQHTEGREEVVHHLLEGENFFGTPADGYSTDIAIENDRYVSRNHANIVVSKDFLGRNNYTLYDNGAGRSDRQSTNGTFVNGHSKRLPKEQQVFLRHGDTIQVGLTKLVLVDIEHAATPDAAKNLVLTQDYTATVELRGML